MIKKNVKLVVGTALGIAIALTLGVTAFCLSGRRQRPHSSTWSTQSPKQTYFVEFSGKAAAASWPFSEPSDLLNHKVTIDVSKEGKSLIKGADIYNADAYDSNFKELYPSTDWFSENGLHLWNKQLSSLVLSRLNQISIKNESGRSLKYLYVRAGISDIFLLFDLPPNDNISLSVHLAHHEDLVGCQGRFGDYDFPYHAADFSSSRKELPANYTITIRTDGCSVVGQQ